MHLLHIVAGLYIAGNRGGKEVVGPTNQAVLAGLIKVFIEVLVKKAFALCRLDDDKLNGLAGHLGTCHAFPIDSTLVMAHI